MGYRSQVAIGIQMNPDIVSELDTTLTPEMMWKTFVTECKARHPKAFNDSYAKMEVHDDKYTMRFMHDGIKWYEGSDLIADFEGTLAIVKEFNEQYNHTYYTLFHSAFIRIGEDSGDIVNEYEGDGYELFDTYTEITGTLTTPFEETVS
jgi:hypothetical protein